SGSYIFISSQDGLLPMKRYFSKLSRLTSAFTLTELMVVMAIVASLMGLIVPVFHSLKGAGDMTKATTEIAGLLEGARSYARANKTYVWVGFSETAEIGQIRISTMASKDGTRSLVPGGTSVDLTQLTPINKLLRIENMHLKTTDA